MAEAELRIAVQRCHSRTRLALRALDRYRARLCQLAGPLPIADAAELVSLVDGIRDLLTGEEVPEVGVPGATARTRAGSHAWGWLQALVPPTTRHVAGPAEASCGRSRPQPPQDGTRGRKGARMLRPEQ